LPGLWLYYYLSVFLIQAYQSWVDDNEKEGQLPDLDLSVDQLFFIGFAMVSLEQVDCHLCDLLIV